MVEYAFFRNHGKDGLELALGTKKAPLLKGVKYVTKLEVSKSGYYQSSSIQFSSFISDLYATFSRTPRCFLLAAVTATSSFSTTDLFIMGTTVSNRHSQSCSYLSVTKSSNLWRLSNARV